MSVPYGAYENPAPGRVKNCSFANFNVWGEKEILTGGFSSKARWKRATLTVYVLKTSFYFGEKIGKDAACVRIEGFTESIEFAEKTE